MKQNGLRRPVTLIHKECFPTRSEALKREAEIKRLPRKKKIELVESSIGYKMYPRV